jgi:hypothetical protein
MYVGHGIKEMLHFYVLLCESDRSSIELIYTSGGGGWRVHSMVQLCSTKKRLLTSRHFNPVPDLEHRRQEIHRQLLVVLWGQVNELSFIANIQIIGKSKPNPRN